MSISRNIFWIAFFASILAAWWWLYSMSSSMNMDLLGRMSMENSMSQMDMPEENISQMSGDGDVSPIKGMSSDDNDKIVSKFKNEADKNGAVLISVLGGRSSEGADFPGEYMQSVIVIGIPYAPPSVQTQSQIEYLESKFPKKGRALAYQIPAINRASQAAGRPVRSLNDVAFIMLGDERFSQKNVFEQLPGWIRDSVERIDYNPNELGKRVTIFFRNL